MTTDLTAQRDDDFEPDEDALAAALRDQDDIPLLLDVVADNSEEGVEGPLEGNSGESSDQESSDLESLTAEPKSNSVSQEAYFMQAVVESDASQEVEEQPVVSVEQFSESETISLNQEEIDLTDVQASMDGDIDDALVFDGLSSEVSDEPELLDDAFAEMEDGSDDAALDVVDEDSTLSMTYSAEQIEEAVSQVLTQRLPELIEEVLKSLQADNDNVNSK